MLHIEIWKENKILRTISTKIESKEIKKYSKIGLEMKKYIKNPKNWWVWLAAPQVWYNKRLIIVSLLKDWDDEDFPTIMMINPEILDNSSEKEKATEWCLSVPKEKWEVARYIEIKLQYLDEKWKTKILILEWLSSRIVQHEIDHLDWILFTDKLEKKTI
jgi:peptide deformylase